MGQASRDQNFVTTLLGVSSVDGVTPTTVYVDPITHRMLVDFATVGGTVTSVSVVTANGFAGSVANPTTTPAITLSTTITGVLKGNGTAISTASAGTDYVAPGAITTSGLTQATNKLLGRTTGSTGAVEEISVGTGLTFSAGSLSAAAGGLTVGTSPIANGTTTRILYDNAGVLGEYTLTGSGTVVAMQTAPTFATSITGSYLTISEMLITDGSKNIVSAPVATYPSLTELTYVKGVTSALQTQLNAKQATGNYITALTGDVTASGPGSVAATLATVNGNVGSFGSATQTGTFTVNGKGLTTAAANVTITPAVGSITGLGTGVATALAVNIGSAGAFVTFNGALGTPSSGVLTNCTGLPAASIVPGTLVAGTYLLGENASIGLDPAGSADGKYSGITITGLAGYAAASGAFGDLVYLAVADSRWEKTDADALATAGNVLIGMMLTDTTSDGGACTILLQGQIRADAKFPALTIGAGAYVGETAGTVQVAIPTGADNIIRVVGFALTADEMYFCPSQDWQVSVA